MGWLFVWHVMLLLPLSTSQDILVPGKSFSANHTLISSPIGTFAIGFFSPENSTQYFLGIWYNSIPKKAIVWVANRESPLASPGVFMLRGDGNLVVLVDGTTKVMWSSNTSVSASDVKATTCILMDSGNLVLRIGGSNLWESFDHPSDTMLPGMKAKLNKRTGQQTLLTSWAAPYNPQPGKFRIGIDPKVTGQIVIWKENAPYYRSAVYFGKEVKPVFGISNGFFISLTHNNDDDEVYFRYDVSDSSIKLRIVLNPNGVFVLLIWKESSSTWLHLWGKPVEKCDFYAHCGPYGVCDRNESLSSSPCKCVTGFIPKIKEQWDLGNSAGGCDRETALTCDGSEIFSKFVGMKLPDQSFLFYNRSMETSGVPHGMGECESKCLQNCSCTAYAYLNTTDDSSGRCFMWFGVLIDLVENHPLGQNIYIRVHSHPSDKGNKGNADNFFKRSHVIAIISSAAGLLTTILAYFLWKKSLKMEGNIRDGMNESNTEVTELPLFSLRYILAATNNFSETNKLGEGGFGPVYKGILPENQEIAIKRLSKKSGQGHQEFMNELKLIIKLQHTNLVRLLGCCNEEEEMILIYEYMPNRSLDKHLFDPSEKTKLNWERRFQIVEGIAQGVLYIHKYSRFKIIHRDLKASNVLLDGEMNPKISDFGMAKIFEVHQTEANTNRVVGTYGYMSPEYALYGHFSEKLDVYSFGVLLLEILSGKKNSSFYRVEHVLTLAGWAWELCKEGRAMEVIDASIRETCKPDEALRCMSVAFLCVQETPADRPTMSSVIHMLQSNEAISLPPSKEPAFSASMSSSTVGTSSQTSASTYSNNGLTMSMPEAR